jgi:hypothetical protein
MAFSTETEGRMLRGADRFRELTFSFSQGLPAPSCNHGILVLHYQR